MNFTQHNIACFRAYVSVQRAGLYNMFDPRAQQLTGLTNKDYTFVMENYSALKAAAEKETS